MRVIDIMKNLYMMENGEALKSGDTYFLPIDHDLRGVSQ